MGSLAAALIALAATPCAYPDEGTMPLRRAVSQVRHLPEIEKWSEGMREKGEAVQYALRLDRPLWDAGTCYWTLEVRVGERVWRTFHVTPAGKIRE